MKKNCFPWKPKIDKAQDLDHSIFAESAVMSGLGLVKMFPKSKVL